MSFYFLRLLSSRGLRAVEEKMYIFPGYEGAFNAIRYKKQEQKQTEIDQDLIGKPQRRRRNNNNNEEKSHCYDEMKLANSAKSITSHARVHLLVTARRVLFPILSIMIS